jgi:1-acyl-sn-glycerol-3-phosphate acyltransferase
MIILRSLAFHAYFYTVTFLCCVAGVPLRLASPARSRALARVWVALAMSGARRLCGIHLVLRGAEHLPAGGPALLASQHQSVFDTLIWTSLLPRPCYVVKQELMQLPLFGEMLRRTGMIGVDRKAGAAALKRLLRDSAEASLDGRQLVIFPEGTRVAPDDPLVLQPGIAAMSSRLSLPVIPVATDSGRRWGRRAFRMIPGPIHLTICPPLPLNMGRAALLAAIEEAWRAAGTEFSGPVDKSVGESGERPRPDRAMGHKRFV